MVPSPGGSQTSYIYQLDLRDPHISNVLDADSMKPFSASYCYYINSTNISYINTYMALNMSELVPKGLHTFKVM